MLGLFVDFRPLMHAHINETLNYDVFVRRSVHGRYAIARKINMKLIKLQSRYISRVRGGEIVQLVAMEIYIIVKVPKALKPAISSGLI